MRTGSRVVTSGVRVLSPGLDCKWNVLARMAARTLGADRKKITNDFVEFTVTLFGSVCVWCVCHNCRLWPCA